MAAVERVFISTEEFDRIAQLPENRGRSLERIAGSLFEVVSNNESSAIAALILSYLGVFVHQHKLGFVTGADGGYKVGADRYIPDGAFISQRHGVGVTDDAYYPQAPDLALEVLSPGNSPEEIRIKVANYLSAGTVVWVVDPLLRRIEVYAPGQAVQVLHAGDILDGGALLPGFALAVSEVFPSSG